MKPNESPLNVVIGPGLLHVGYNPGEGTVLIRTGDPRPGGALVVTRLNADAADKFIADLQAARAKIESDRAAPIIVGGR
jgi:hypothetical protein